ncbi:MAG: glucoamylase family protein [Caldimonas sp.]
MTIHTARAPAGGAMPLRPDGEVAWSFDERRRKTGSPLMHRSQDANLLAFGESRLDELQCHAFSYFLHETDETTGLIADTSRQASPASIAAVGFAISAYPVAVERGWLSRDGATRRTLILMRFLWKSPQGTEANATGYKGFYYHFLDMSTGRRAGLCELSTIDTTFLLAGMLAAARYFDCENEDEQEIRTLADMLYRRVDWSWACNGGATVTHGWTPEGGFLPYRWEGYDEALLLYVLGLGSPTHPLPPESYTAWASTYEWTELYGHACIYAGPLFIHQYSHVWLDMRGIQDAYMRARGIDYFENSRRAAYIQQAYAVQNPLAFAGYGANFWGLTASDGPGDIKREVRGVERTFFDYVARGAPYGPDDGTIAPWAVLTSLPFAPEIVLPTVKHLQDVYPQTTGDYCFRCSFNLSFSNDAEAGAGWTSPYHFGINLGPVVLMCENYRSGLLWQLMRACPYVVTGFRRAGFRKGWL